MNSLVVIGVDSPPVKALRLDVPEGLDAGLDSTARPLVVMGPGRTSRRYDRERNLMSSLFGAAIIGAGAGAYWGGLAAAMVCAFGGLAWVRSHFPALVRDETIGATAR